MYLTNNQRIDLDLIGPSDQDFAVIQKALGTHPGQYVADVPPPAPAAPAGGGPKLPGGPMLPGGGPALPGAPGWGSNTPII